MKATEKSNCKKKNVATKTHELKKNREGAVGIRRQQGWDRKSVDKTKELVPASSSRQLLLALHRGAVILSSPEREVQQQKWAKKAQSCHLGILATPPIDDLMRCLQKNGDKSEKDGTSGSFWANSD